MFVRFKSPGTIICLSHISSRLRAAYSDYWYGELVFPLVNTMPNYLQPLLPGSGVHVLKSKADLSVKVAKMEQNATLISIFDGNRALVQYTNSPKYEVKDLRYVLVACNDKDEPLYDDNLDRKNLKLLAEKHYPTKSRKEQPVYDAIARSKTHQVTRSTKRTSRPRRGNDKIEKVPSILTYSPF